MMSNAKRRRFVAAIMRSGTATLNEKGFWTPLGGTGAATPREVAELLSQGVLTQRDGQLAPTSVTKHWLRRQSLGVGELAAAHPQKCTIASIDRLAATTSTQAPFLSAHHVEAARRLRKLAETAQLRQRTTMSFDAAGKVDGSRAGGAELSDFASDARSRLSRLLSTMPSDIANVITDICVLERGLGDIERARHWPSRSAKLLLRAGLELVASHFGLAASAQGSNKGRGIRSLRAEQARPWRLE